MKKVILLSIFAAVFQVGCGLDSAPTSIYDSVKNNRSYVIYGEDSIREVELSTPNSRISVALMSRESRERLASNDYIATVEDRYGKIPFSWIDQPAAAFCSGVLIAKDTVLTAGHCLKTVGCEDLIFVFQHEKNNANSIVTRQCAEVLRQKDSLADTGLDYALIRMNESISIEPAKISTSPIEVGQKVYSLGFPLGSYKKSAEGDIREIMTDPHVYVSTLDVFEGNSGGPVFSSKTHELIGIISAGERDFLADPDNIGHDIVNVCGESECMGEYIVPIEKILADKAK